MPVIYEFSYVDDEQPLERGNAISSGSVASGAASSAFSEPGVVTLTATEDGYVIISPTATNGATDPRRRLLAGVARSFLVMKNDKIGFTAG